MTSSYWFQGDSAPGPDQGDPIGQSLRFRKGPWLEQPTPGLGNRRTFTVSFWTKLGTKQGGGSSYQLFQSGATSGNPVSGMQWMPSPNWGDYLRVDSYAGGNQVNLHTDAAYRDPSAWYHIVYAVDTTRDNETDRLRIYVNGENQTLTGTYPSKDYQMEFNDQGAGKVFTIGANTASNGAYEGYMAEFYSIDGQALLPTAFGRYNREGVWVPVKPDFSQSAVSKYSDGLTSTVGVRNAEKAFDGDTSTYADADIGAGSDTLIWEPVDGIYWTTSVEVYTPSGNPGDGSQLIFINGVQTAAIGANAWTEVATGGGTLNTLAIQNTAGASGRISGIRVDGEILTNPFLYSADATSSTGAWFAATKTNTHMFDGDLNSYGQTSTTDGSITWEPSNPIPYTQSVRVYCLRHDTDVYNFNDEGDVSYGVPGGGAFGWVTLKTGSGSINKIEWTGFHGGTICAIEVDGQILVDGVNNSFGQNGFHLDFSDPNDLGADRSGNGNDFTATGFNTDTVGIFSNDIQGSGGTYETDPANRTAPILNRTLTFNGPVDGGSQTDSDPVGWWYFPREFSGVNSIEVDLYFSDPTGALRINGNEVAYTRAVLSNPNLSRLTVTNPPSNVTEIACISNRPNTQTAQILINGRVLTDNTGEDYDLMLDSPTQNFGTYDPLLQAVQGGGGSNTYKPTPTVDANLKVESSAQSWGTGNFSFSSGKWYYECKVGYDDGSVVISPSPWSSNSSTLYYQITPQYGYTNSGSGRTFGPAWSDHITTGLTQYVAGDVVGCAIDFDNGRIFYSVNGVWQNGADPVAGTNAPIEVTLNDREWTLGAASGEASPKFAALNFGQQDGFVYDAPTGYQAVQTQNLPKPTIVDGGEHFRVLTGSGASILSVAQGQANGDNGTGFQRGLWWIKGRGTGNNQLLDTVRGGDKILYSDGPNAEATYTTPTTDCVAWCWKAGDSVATNNNGTIESQVSANTDAGFSIVTWNGTGALGSIGHGLNQTPDLIIIKSLNRSASWVVWTPALNNNHVLHLNATDAQVNQPNAFQDTVATSTVINLGTGAEADTNRDTTSTGTPTHVAYCWNSVPGYSKIGNYVGNGNDDGPVIHCGFKPAYIMTKRVDSTSNWFILDAARNTYNPLYQWLEANEAAQEQNNQVPAYTVDFLANGFKIRGTGDVTNINNGEYVYIAFAQHPQGGSKIAPETAGFQGPVQYSGILPGIASSLRFRGAQNLKRSFTAGVSDIKTVSFWMKKGVDSTSVTHLFTGGSLWSVELDTAAGDMDGVPNGIGIYDGTSHDMGNGSYRDPSAWYHVVATTVSTSARIWVNGELMYEGGRNQVNFDDITIGSYYDDTFYFEGYLADVYFIDGQSLEPTVFGQYTDDGVWVPKDVEISDYGANGFHLVMDPAYIVGDTLRDQSGNGNDFTMTGFETNDFYSSAFDFMKDSPTQNYATGNPLFAPSSTGSVTTGSANLSKTGATPSINGGLQPTFPWDANAHIYFEVKASNYPFNTWHGFLGNPGPNSSQCDGNHWYSWAFSGRNPLNTVGCRQGAFANLSFTPDFTVNENVVKGFEWDGPNRVIRYYENGVLCATSNQWAENAIETAAFYFDYNNAPTTPWAYNFGQQPFINPPAGAQPLQTQNLPEATIPNGRDHFNAVTYTGNGTQKSVADLSFQPDLVWIKNRDASTNNALTDSVRGPELALVSDSIAGESSNDGTRLSSFDSNGFTVGTNSNFNASGESYVAWCWKAGGAAAANNDGDIQSQVSVNKQAGFSIVTYTGSGTSGDTVGHGLDKAPEFVIIKNRIAGENWQVKHSDLNPDQNLELASNTTKDAQPGNGYISSIGDVTITLTAGSSNLNNVNRTDDLYVMYCWHSVPGFSHVGSFEGSGIGNVDGAFVYCGFKPAFILTKDADTDGTNWIIKDTARVTSNPDKTRLQPNETAAEETGPFDIDFLSNGFKVRDASGDINQGTIVYIAFAENPFSYPTTAR